MIRVKNLVLLPLALLVFVPVLSAVEYEVTFNADWSRENHPLDFPPGAHFSPLIGATHTDDVIFWEPGGISTPGIELMAETGGRSTLQNEINTAIALETAQNLILGSGTASPGVTSTTFEVTDSHPLVTLVTMIAPSPDWFVGIHGLDFRDESGQWIENLTVDLLAYDSGTDSGPNFRSPNEDTSPPEPIALLGAPLLDTPPLGAFTFRLADQPPIIVDPPVDPEPPVDPVLSKIALGLTADFEDGTNQGWTEGPTSPNLPTNVSEGGNSGSFLENSSSGTGGAGSRMVTYNRDEWIGDYVAAGVTQIDVDFKNLGDSGEPLAMRFALQGPGNTRFGSSEAFSVPADDQWHSVAFGVTEDHLTRISGTASLEQVLMNTSEVRFVAAEASVAWIGDRIEASVGLDNIVASSLEVFLDADLNRNGSVDFADFLILSSTFGLTDELPDPNGDIDGNGTVEFADFLILSSSFGQSSTSPVSAVPEPSGAMLLFAGVCSLGCVRRCRRKRCAC